MSTNNYFRCGNVTAFFDVHEPTTIHIAWTRVLNAITDETGLPWVWLPFLNDGPWTGCNVIGHQSVGLRPTDAAGAEAAWDWQVRRSRVDKLWMTVAA